LPRRAGPGKLAVMSEGKQRRGRTDAREQLQCRTRTSLAVAGAIVLGVAGIATAAAAVITRRRGTYPPPADAPPRVDAPLG